MTKEEKAKLLSHEVVSSSKTDNDIDKIIWHINNLKYDDQTSISDDDKNYIIDRIISALASYKEKLEETISNFGESGFTSSEISRINSISSHLKNMYRETASNR